jgi:Na+/H+-translocating membrane pyrophosphatase
LLPLRALEARRSGRRVGHVGFALAAAAVLAVATLQFGLSWLDAFGPLAGNAGGGTRYALPSRLEQLGVPRAVAVTALGLAFAVAYGWLLREAWRGRARLGLAAGLALLATPYLAPWYLVWAVPLAAVDDDRPARLLALGLTAYLLPQTIPV